MRFHEIVNEVDTLLVQGSAACLERAVPLLRELSALVLSLHPKQRGEVQAELRTRAVLWDRLLEGARSFISGWSCAVLQIAETYTAEGALRAGFSSGRLRVDG